VVRFLLLIALSPGHPIFSDLHRRVSHGFDVHAVLESFFGGSADTPPAPLGLVVIPGRQAQGNDDHSTDDGQEDHLLHLVHMRAGEQAPFEGNSEPGVIRYSRRVISGVVVTLAGPALRPGGMGSPSHLPLWLIPAHTRVVGALARVRKWYDGSGWFVAGAVVLLVIAALALLAGLQSPDRLLWTGQGVTGAEHQGIVYYSWHGQSYSIDASGNGSAKDVSVYLDPADPSQAMIDNVPDRVVAGLLIAGPVVAALVLLVLGGTRNYRWFRQKIRLVREYRG